MKAVCIGELRHRVSVLSRTLTASSTGDQTETWATDFTVWARIEPLSGREYWEGEQVKAEATHKVLMRYRSGVAPINRISYNSRVFEIVDARNLEERDRYIMLSCKELK